MMNTARVDVLARLPLLARLLKSRLFQPVLQIAMLFCFTLAIITGLFGTPVGNRNFGIVFVWIVWWALLIVVFVPLLGRAWCLFCPIPAPGEWLQRRAVVGRLPGSLKTLNRRWPRRLKNMWLQNIGFLLVAMFSGVILTRPNISGWVLAGFILAATGLSLIYDKRVFCRYVCPVGGFIGLYSMMSPVEVRVRDRNVCACHKTKDCVIGNAAGYGCPWMVYPGNLERNTYCGMCTECIKTCPKNNVTVNLRPFGDDLLVVKEHRMDEAYKAFIMLGCALLYSAVFLGPWGWLKDAANMETLGGWLAYIAGFWFCVMLALPGLYGLSVIAARRVARQTAPLRALFVGYAYTLVPLGLAAWIAFSVGFVFTNGSYALSVLSDPFGWGWNLFGTADAAWSPLWPSLVGFLQVGLLTAGLLFAVRTAFRIACQHSESARAAFAAALPLTVFLTAVTGGFLWLYLG